MKEKIKNVKREIQSLLIDHAPNGVLIELLYSKLNKYPEPLLDGAIKELVFEESIKVNTSTNKFIPGRKRTVLGLRDYKNIPIKTSIEIGGVTFPRFIHGDMTTAEELNYAFEALSIYNSQLEERFKGISEELTKGYWKNLVSIFGIMLSMFALIIKSISTIPTLDYQTVSLIDIFLIRLAEFLPLSIVLFVGILILRKIIR